MVDTPDIATLASLIGEPARASMLTALMSGQALTATELALEAGIAPSTASSHLARLLHADVIAIEKQGRHRYFRLHDAEIAEMLEQLSALASRNPRRVVPGPRDSAMRVARVCYDHLAGEYAVRMLDSLRRQKILTSSDTPALTSSAGRFLATLGIDVDELSATRRPVCRPCLDWSERRSHLAGALGAAILTRMTRDGWLHRQTGSRAVSFTRKGEAAFRAAFPDAGRPGPNGNAASGEHR